jgi:hypothetical protein
VKRFTRVEDVVDLLASSISPAAQSGARRLLQQMSTETWYVIRGAHRSPDDPNQHVTIEVHRNRYHLRLDRRECVYDITCYVAQQVQRPAGREPWTRPGA